MLLSKLLVVFTCDHARALVGHQVLDGSHYYMLDLLLHGHDGLDVGVLVITVDGNPEEELRCVWSAVVLSNLGEVGEV